MPLGAGTTGFDYRSKVNSIYAVFAAANTTTADIDLSGGMTLSVQTIEVNDPEAIGIRWTDIPALYIRVRDGVIEHADMGPAQATARGRHFKTVIYDIFGLYRRGGRMETAANHLQAVYNYAANVEAVIANNPTMDNSALWAYARRTDFGDAFVNGDSVKGFRVELEARYYFR